MKAGGRRNEASGSATPGVLNDFSPRVSDPRILTAAVLEVEIGPTGAQVTQLYE